MLEIVRYISRKLHNPAAAERLAAELVHTAESLLPFPYAAPACRPIRPLEHEYRKIPVRNFLIFYWIDEEKKLVTVRARGVRQTGLRPAAEVMARVALHHSFRNFSATPRAAALTAGRAARIMQA